MGQRVPGNTKWRNPPWAVWRLPLNKMEETPLGSLAAPADLEESAPHRIARQRRPLASRPCILPCLTASIREIYYFLSYSLTLTPPNLSRMDFLAGPAAINGSRLITWGAPSRRGRGCEALSSRSCNLHHGDHVEIIIF